MSADSEDAELRAINRMLDIQWSTSWGHISPDVESHAEKAFEHLSRARDLAEQELDGDGS